MKANIHNAESSGTGGMLGASLGHRLVAICHLIVELISALREHSGALSKETGWVHGPDFHATRPTLHLTDKVSDLPLKALARVLPSEESLRQIVPIPSIRHHRTFRPFAIGGGSISCHGSTSCESFSWNTYCGGTS
jgi:hypothetical protein